MDPLQWAKRGPISPRKADPVRAKHLNDTSLSYICDETPRSPRRFHASSRSCIRKLMSQMLDVRTRSSRTNGPQRSMTCPVMPRPRANALTRALAHAPSRPRPRARHACADVPASGQTRPGIEALTQTHLTTNARIIYHMPTRPHAHTNAFVHTRPRVDTPASTRWPIHAPPCHQTSPRAYRHARPIFVAPDTRQRAPARERAHTHTQTRKRLNRKEGKKR